MNPHYHGRDFYAELVREDLLRQKRLTRLGVAIYLVFLGWLGYHVLDWMVRWDFLGYMSKAMRHLD